MSHDELKSFPADVARKLKTYVYRLIDPRNGETFYVGKGQGDRVFAHVRGEPVAEVDEISSKLKRIRAIRLAGLDVGHVIHRHGMDDATAFEVEAALIEAYPGLTNIAGGNGSDEFGTMHAREIVKKYAAEPADFAGTRALLISVNGTAADAASLYEACRYAWKINRSNAERAEVVLATLKGEIVDAFIPDKWLDATTENFPGREPAPGRIGFVGTEASDEIKRRFVGKRVPDEYRKRGAAFPVKYTW